MQKKTNFLPTFVVFLFVCLLLFAFGKMGLLQKPVSVVQQLGLSLFPKNQQAVDTTLNDITKQVAQSTLAKDNQILRDQLLTATPSSHLLLPARVVGMPTFIPGVTAVETMVVDKGSADGIKKGQVVVYKNNIIGKIVTVSQHLSQVNVISAKETTVSAQTPAGSLGIIRGQGDNKMLLDNVLPAMKISRGDLVLTKGDQTVQGSGTPPNLIIGQILAVHKQPSALFQTAEVQSFLDFSTLSLVFILQQ